MAKRYIRNEGELHVLRQTYEMIAVEKSQKKYANFHSQCAYQAGFMEAVDLYIKPKKRSEEQFHKESMLQNAKDE